MVSNSAKLDRRTKQHTQFGVSASNGSRDMARTKSWRAKKKKIKKKNNEANWIVSYSAKLDSSTKQHTQFGVSVSNGSRDMARTKVAEKKKMNVDDSIKHPLRGSLIIYNFFCGEGGAEPETLLPTLKKHSRPRDISSPTPLFLRVAPYGFAPPPPLFFLVRNIVIVKARSS